jgi:hypothetical protein
MPIPHRGERLASPMEGLVAAITAGKHPPDTRDAAYIPSQTAPRAI